MHGPVIGLRMMKHTMLVAAMCLLAASPAVAQTTGELKGTVVDAAGQPVAGIAVTARHVATDTTYGVKTDELGQYRFAALPPGKYQVTTAASPSLGASRLTVSVTLGASTTASFDPSTPPAEPGGSSGGGRRSIAFEASGHVGWTFSEGVEGAPVVAADGKAYSRIDPADSVSWGFTFGVFLTSHIEVEFLFDRQQSTLQASGTNTVDVGDFGVGNYHGILSYNFGARDAPLRLYAFGGAGATTYGGLTFTGPDGQTRTIDGDTKLSTTFGGGVKIYRGRLGARLELRMTPTYIKSDDVGWACDDYWGCYTIEEADYSRQVQFSGGVTVRF
jgi:hypothetical protein